ncbi:MAG: NAD(P)(+) transhydrogenase (Re/Si-specific) subunit beta [Deltaproteobacteria bacterium]|nr:NAD(P)(+) transhydrogenase (Re/Si-specific) subunit beta [Deltaproteobacteria bacterium]MBW2693533.1 NAD(P)(+) transhydrogenase (Re/Si-specific) subunit beta [Deltaproteobacteria bacterium]
MSETSLAVLYLIAAVLFILSLGGLSNQETARRGNIWGIVGMTIALVGTLLHPHVESYLLISPAILAGAIIGAILAARVVMTAMPQLVAMLHSFVGLAAVLVGIASYLSPEESVAAGGRAAIMVHEIEIWVGVAVGAITFTGSVIAWGKLRGSISGSPMLLPGRHAFNFVMVAAVVVMAVFFVSEQTSHDLGLTYLLIMTAITCVLGIHLVMAIGGADMPVVVSLLNSYSGWAAAAAGFMLNNDLLIVTGALVGSSGAILSYIMCRAMNRSILAVVFGGFGTGDAKPAAGGDEVEGEAQPIEAAAVCDLLKASKEVIIVPGYGLAVARAQHLVNELANKLREDGVNVRYAIHPVAGRLPGHMNVLLAEAGVPYDIVLEMDEINADFSSTSVALVIGANDVANPGAETDSTSPIYGMPVLKVWNAENVIVLKRSMASGYAGVQNPLFFLENTQMLFGDAKDSIGQLVSGL